MLDYFLYIFFISYHDSPKNAIPFVMIGRTKKAHKNLRFCGPGFLRLVTRKGMFGNHFFENILRFFRMYRLL